ncbi:hypothetical protein BU24DRAFT_247858 [Aaosphaeria arxii CBS 175.79]|uniref:Uncharacterized protein n=1 Tax=Aaosphaeria arxii CBS 175.79 TaxID=1450172 RepID=A0A6A5XKZ7_9PLEO|nr:uncharacterized protein BU24DRAFT_247858 [Aaosphaeria arxii CBS 175.79]KAF2013812.1 hypothetical protein BU24DRAFT_247858 [Aaosphaeria arxii CBS 175.79]
MFRRLRTGSRDSRPLFILLLALGSDVVLCHLFYSKSHFFPKQFNSSVHGPSSRLGIAVLPQQGRPLRPLTSRSPCHLSTLSKMTAEQVPYILTGVNFSAPLMKLKRKPRCRFPQRCEQSFLGALSR